MSLISYLYTKDNSSDVFFLSLRMPKFLFWYIIINTSLLHLWLNVSYKIFSHMRFSRYSAQVKADYISCLHDDTYSFFLHSEPARDRNSECCEVQCMHFSRRFDTLMEMKGFEPTTPCLQGRCSPNWATPPWCKNEKFLFVSLLLSFIDLSALATRLLSSNSC